ncbi:ribonuclease H-like domain-containing protein [Tanacetum coccineum]
MILGRPFVNETRLVYDKDEGTVTFEKEEEKIVFKMPHKMEMFKHIDKDILKTENIPSFIMTGDDGIWEPLAGPKLADMTDAKYNSQDEKAHSTILISLSDEVLYTVTDEETAAEGSALKDHLDALNSILMDLKNVEVKIGDEDAALILLVSLPPSFENFINSFVVGKDTIVLKMFDPVCIPESFVIKHREVQNLNLYPVDFGKKKAGQNFKKQNVSNNNFVGKSSSFGFTDEQMVTLISPIKDNKVGKNMQANMAGANQHMTYTDKELYNVLDISHLKIKVGHPNRAEAYISKIGNLRLSNGLTLYDVMVIPEYCVTLIYVHKWVKENKVIVAFDENRCYFLNQDFNLKNVLGIGEQCKGLYYYNDQGHPVDPVLNVLKDSLSIDKKDNVFCCEICQRAKQTKEPFPLSDHTSKRLGDLVHLDLWGPYKIPYDDERVANDLNKGKSDSSSSSVFGSNINIADFLVDYENDADSSDEFVATQNEEVATLEENVFSEASKYPHWTDAMNQEMDALLRNGLVSDKGVFLTLLVYMDDIIITGNSISEIEKFKVYLKSKFMIKDLGKLKYFLGIEVVDTDKGIYLNQRKYFLDLLSEYGMIACKPAKTPLMSKLVISNKASDKDPLLENITDYQKLMGKLIYLTNTRPYISYVVHCLSQFMHSPLTSHLKIAFKILRYLKSCPGLGIHITKTSAIKIAVNPVFHERTKHLEINLHFVREKILKGVVKTVKVDSANQIADILTKGFDTI